MSLTVNPTSLDVDDFHNMTFDGNIETWWLALPTKLYTAVSPTEGLPTTLKGKMFCPRWDKLILSPTPASALCNMCYHATEVHIESNNWEHAKMLSLCTNSTQQKRHIGGGTINLFNMGTQLQGEAGHALNLQRTRSQQFSYGTSWPTSMEATSSNRLPLQRASNKDLFGTSTHLCPVNR